MRQHLSRALRQCQAAIGGGYASQVQRLAAGRQPTAARQLGTRWRSQHASITYGATRSAALAQRHQKRPIGQQTALARPAVPIDPTKPRLVLVDAMAWVHRYHHGFGDTRLRNGAGDDTTVMYGVLNTLLLLLEATPPPTHLAAVFDAPGKTFRHELYAGYKAQRPPMPETLSLALGRLHDLLAAVGIPVFVVSGVEADDVIGTLATLALQQGLLVDIASPDKDFFQLLQPGLRLLRPGGIQVSAPLVPWTEVEFAERYPGIRPSQWVDYLALAGDASDNVPGVKGIGEKTALAMLAVHGDLEGVLAHADECKRATARAALGSAEGAATARLSRQLVEIQAHLDLPPVNVPLDNLRLVRPADGGAEALALMADLQFRKHSVRMQALWENFSQ